MASPYFTDRLIPSTRRWYKGIRPANFPPRRLAGVSHLLTRLAGSHGPVHTLIRHLRGLGDCPPQNKREVREALARLATLFTVDEPGEYWSWHFTLGGKRSPRPLALVGESAARSLVFNVALPMGLLWARRERDAQLEAGLWAFLARFPPLPSNEVTSFMERRLFGGDSRCPRLLNLELRRQALFHIFQDCCFNNEKTCADCVLLSLEGSAPAGPPALNATR